MAGRACLLNIESAGDECLTKLYPIVAKLRRRAPMLRAFAWSGFQDAGSD